MPQAHEQGRSPQWRVWPALLLLVGTSLAAGIPEPADSARWKFGNERDPEWSRFRERRLGEIDAWWSAFAEKRSDIAALFEREQDWDLPEWMAEDLGPRWDLAVVPPPVDVPRFTIAAHWMERRRTDPLHRWFRQVMRDASTSV